MSVSGDVKTSSSCRQETLNLAKNKLTDISCLNAMKDRRNTLLSGASLYDCYPSGHKDLRVSQTADPERLQASGFFVNDSVESKLAGFQVLVLTKPTLRGN